MSTLLLGYLLKSTEEIAKIIVKVLVVLAVVLILLELLPVDPFQAQIDAWTASLAPYMTLLNFFVPVEFCVYALAFFIAFKYLLKPAYTFIFTIAPESDFWMPKDHSKYV